ncbi:hypothetical protein D3C77_504540 [compost metagenome]
MKAGDIIAISHNPLIMGATFSSVSHVAIALNDKEVAEIIPGHLRKISLRDCIGSCRRAYIYERPATMQALNVVALEAEYRRLLDANTKYSKWRMLYSGFLPSVRNIMHGGAMITALMAAWKAQPAYAYYSFYFLLHAPLVYLSQKICARLATEKNQKIPVIGRLFKDIPGEFCSSLVVELDNKSGGQLKAMINKNHEPRPNDVIAACNVLRYTKCKLK